jgi:hypothetical protein
LKKGKLEANSEINAIDKPTKSRCSVKELELEFPSSAEKGKKILPATPTEGTHASIINHLSQIER